MLLCLLLLAATVLPTTAAPRARVAHHHPRAERRQQHVLSQAEIDRMLGVNPKRETETVKDREADFQYRLATEGLHNTAPGAAAGDQVDDVQRFLRIVDGAVNLGDADFVASARLRRDGSDDLVITVRDVWHFMPFNVRLECAEAYAGAWSQIHKPTGFGRSEISLVDYAGHPVGGTGFGGAVHVDR